MIRNYLLTAWKVLLRRKAFTFISLFGITLTLTILLVCSTVLDNTLFPQGPQRTSSNFLQVQRVKTVSADKNSTWRSGPGFKFLSLNVARLASPEKISFFSMNERGTSFLAGQKLINTIKRTDAIYWEILDFDFIEGRVFSKSEFERGAMVCVINKSTKGEFFKDGQAMGQRLVVNNQSFEVIGVVEDVPFFEDVAFADIWVPYTSSASTQYRENFMGGWAALLYHPNPKMLQDIKEEYAQILKDDLKTTDPERFAVCYSTADSMLERIARTFSGSMDEESGIGLLFTMLALLALGFMVLPSINLINLNISRILERSSEIGIRKAFGASSRELVFQFLVENLLITTLGGLLGLLFSWLILFQIDQSGLIPGFQYHISLHVLLYGLGLVFVFGVVSGVYPAYRMSKLHPVNALKGSV